MIILLLMGLLALSIICGVLYRMGGSQYYDTLYRDLGIPIILLVINLFYLPLHWSFILQFFSMWGALSTYWDFLPFNKEKDNFYIHGLFCGLSGAFLLFICPTTWGFHLTRVVLLCVFMGLWNKFRPTSIRLFNHIWDGAQIEEFGRGFAIMISYPLCLPLTSCYIM